MPSFHRPDCTHSVLISVGKRCCIVMMLVLPVFVLDCWCNHLLLFFARTCQTLYKWNAYIPKKVSAAVLLIMNFKWPRHSPNLFVITEITMYKILIALFGIFEEWAMQVSCPLKKRVKTVFVILQQRTKAVKSWRNLYNW